jgi:hypothetical protein
MRDHLVAAAFAARKAVPAPLRRAMHGVPGVRTLRALMRRKSVETMPAYDPAVLTAALAAGTDDRIAADVLSLSALGDALSRRAKSALLDASGVDDVGFVTAMNMLAARGLCDVRLLPPARTLAAAKQAWGPLVHDEAITTRVLVHNYFARNYVIEDAVLVLLLAQLRDGLRYLASRLLVPDATVVWRLGDVLGERRVPVAEGASVVVVAAHPSMARVATREFRYVVTVDSSASAGASHSIAATRYRVPQELGNGTKAYLTPLTTALDMVKGVGDPSAGVRWTQGRLDAERGMTRPSVIRDSDAGGWGALAFTFSQPLRTPSGFYIGRDEAGGLYLHHDQGAQPRPATAFVPAPDFVGRRYLSSLAMPLFNDKDVDIGIVIDGRNMVNTYRAFDVRICDDAGRVRAERRVPMPDPLLVIDLAELRRAARLPHDACGYVHLIASPDGAVVRDLVDPVMAFGFFRHGARLLDMVEAGTSPYADFRPVVSGRVIDTRRLSHRAKKFAPVSSDTRWKTKVWVINLGFDRTGGPASVSLSLRQPEGIRVVREVLQHGEARLWDLDDIFDLGRERAVDAAVWLESREANLFGIFVYEDRDDARRFALDHLTGG